MSDSGSKTYPEWIPSDAEDLHRAFLEWTQALDVVELSVGVLVVALTVVFRRPISRGLLALLQKFFGILSAPLGEGFISELESPMRVLVVVCPMIFLLHALYLPQMLEEMLLLLLKSVLVIAVFASAFKTAPYLISHIAPRAPAGRNADKDWATRVAQSAIIISGAGAFLKVWGIDISAALTGVGILGAGIAIAAQDLVRNLVAGMSNVSEERFVKGDWIEVTGIVEGIVHKIDIRSTTILGFDRIPHYVPNADLANAVIRNKTRRDHRRVHWVVDLVLSTNADQIAFILDGLHTHLRECGDFVVEDDVLRLVNIGGISKHSVEVVIYAYTVTNGYAAYLEVCERLTQTIRSLVTSADTELAYPTRTIHHEKAD